MQDIHKATINFHLKITQLKLKNQIFFEVYNVVLCYSDNSFLHKEISIKIRLPDQSMSVNNRYLHCVMILLTSNVSW